jgi:hypothetical protein
MARDFTVVAIISAYNEADILAPVLRHLIDEGLSVYLLDHASTDGTARAAEPFLGRGLLAIEPFPGDRFPAARDAFAWRDILTRKTEISSGLDADWFIHHDADEFRESPWEGIRLLDAIRRVDGFGYNAIDFEVFNFVPTDDCVRPGDDPRAALRYYEPGRQWDKKQVKCWKKTDAPCDLVSSAGHDVMFAGRRVFPLRFILRHYPFRSQAQAARKVFLDRRPRFVPEEIARGWHVQYGEIGEGHAFVRGAETLVAYDADAARLSLVLAHRDVEALQAALDTSATTMQALEAEIAAQRADADSHRAEIERQRTEIDRFVAAARAQHVVIDRLVSDIRSLEREVAALHESKSWRWTAPLRAVHRHLTQAGRGRG